MKKTCISLLVVLFALNLNAQDEPKGNDFQNEVGVTVTDLLNGSFQFKYERLIGEHISVALGVGLKGKEGIIRLSGLDTDNISTNDITYSGFKIIPEVRYYVNKTQLNKMDGFYFGAYLKYSNYSSDLDGTYTNDADETTPLAFDADFNVTSLGFMVGYKLPIGKRFNIDFLIAGPGAGFHNYSLKNTEDLPDEFYDDLNQALDQYSIFDLLDGDFEFKNTNENAKFTIPSFRYGITLGYSF